MGRWDSPSLAGPANAGKVALLLERYLARLDDEPTLIVPNASDVDRVERDLLARCGCLFSGSIETFDRLFERLVRDDPAQAPRCRRCGTRLVVGACLRTAPLNGLSRSAATGGFADTLLQTIGELEQGCSTPTTSTATSRRCTASTAPSSTGSGSGTGTCSAAAPPSGSRPSSTHGTASPFSPTGSRTSPAPSGRCSRRSRGAPT